MLAAVDERDRDLLAVLTLKPVVAHNAALLPRHAQLAAHLLDDGAGVVAQVAAGPAEHQHARLAHVHDHIGRPN